MKNRFLNLRIGKTGPIGFIAIGVLLVFFGSICLIGSYYLVAGILMTIGLAILLSFTGVRLDLEQERIKPHTNVLGLRFGKWESMEKFPDIVVLNRKVNRGSRMYSFYQKDECSVYLMSPNHLRQIRIYRCYFRSQANEKAQLLAKILGREWVQYNPGMRYRRQVKN